MKAPMRLGLTRPMSRVSRNALCWPKRAEGEFLERLWLFFFPLLFLPNLGRSRTTAYGVLELADFLIVPYLVCLWAGRSRAYPRCSDSLGRVLLAFVAWAFLGTVTINLRYDYGPDTHALYFGLLKLAKLTLYGIAGMLTASRVRDASTRREFHWSLLGVIAVLGVSLIVGPGKQAAPEALRMGYKANNSVSVGVVIVTGYVGALLAAGYGSRRWRRTAAAAVALGLAGSFLSGGRGGWLAAAVATPYVLWRRGLRAVGIGVALGFLLVSYISYRASPEFKARLERTVSPDPEFLARYGSGVGGIDDGSRVGIWLWEGPRVLDAPLWGTGFYHRGRLTNLSWTGSHSFFLQMFLETGMIGGLLVLMAFRRMWVDAGLDGAQRALLTTPLRTALVAAVVGGMGGEYFYANTALLALFAVYAATGGLPAPKRPVEAPKVRKAVGMSVGHRRGASMYSPSAYCERIT